MPLRDAVYGGLCVHGLSTPIFVLFYFLRSHSLTLFSTLFTQYLLTKLRHLDRMFSTGEQAGFEASSIRSSLVGCADWFQATIVRPDGTRFSMLSVFYLGFLTDGTKMSMKSSITSTRKDERSRNAGFRARTMLSANSRGHRIS
jgi:hypothetical protein